jgi:hypothetical protein
MTDGLVELSLILIVFDCDLAKFTLLLFFCFLFFWSKNLHLHLDAALWFAIFFIHLPHLEPEMEMKQVEFFYPVWFVWLLDLWSILCAQPEATQFKTLDVIHLRYTRPHVHTYVQSRR